MRSGITRWLLLITGALAAGCAAPLPVHPWRGSDDALAALRRRAESVRTMSATCTTALKSAAGQTIVLDGALVADGNHRLHIRAWKLNQTVFDLTLNGDGLWVWVGDQGRGGQPLPAEATAQQIASVWSLVTGRLFIDGAPTVIDDGGSTFLVRGRRPKGAGEYQARIERCSLTVRDYRLTDSSGAMRQSLLLDDYRMVDGVPWPMRLTAEGDEGTITISLDDIEINGSLPAAAFTPAAGAVRKP
jgi:hypothetical protein